MSRGVGILVGLMLVSSTSESVVGRALRWAAEREVATGGTVSLGLPHDLKTASSDGLVDIAVLRDGRRCVLLKTKITYKGNFDGLVSCSAPLLPGEVISGGKTPREYISLSGHQLFEELYVRRRIDDHSFEVFFDLN